MLLIRTKIHVDSIPVGNWLVNGNPGQWSYTQQSGRGHILQLVQIPNWKIIANAFFRLYLELSLHIYSLLSDLLPNIWLLLSSICESKLGCCSIRESKLGCCASSVYASDSGVNCEILVPFAQNGCTTTKVFLARNVCFHYVYWRKKPI